MTVFNNFVSSLNNIYGKINPVDFAKNLFKENADSESAVVTWLSTMGIAGFRFHLPKREQIKMESEITDYYTDINSPIQDHIAQKPITITMNGLQGEYFYSVNQIQDKLALIIPTISLVKQFLPKVSDVVMKNKTKKIETNTKADTQKGTTSKVQTKSNENTLNKMDLWNIFQELYKLKSAQTRAFFFFESMWKSKAVFTVETTWRRYDNMVIKSVTPLKEENSDITDFTVTFQQMNFTQSKSENAKKAAGRVAQQKAAIIKKGVDKGEKVSPV